MNNTSRTETISGTFTMNKKRLALLGVAALMALGLAAQNVQVIISILEIP